MSRFSGSLSVRPLSLPIDRPSEASHLRSHRDGCTVVKIDKQNEGHPQHVMFKVFATKPHYNFACMVVDKDVDIHDLNDVWWAFLARGPIDKRTMLIDTNMARTTLTAGGSAMRRRPTANWMRLPGPLHPERTLAGDVRRCHPPSMAQRAGAHPVGGITGAPGANAVQILSRRRTS